MADQVFAVNSGFYDAVNSDRTYSADDMNRPYKRVVSNGVFATPKGTKSTDLQVVSANNGMQIIVKKGEGIFADKWFENPAAVNITVPANTSTVPRIDSVIVQVDKRTSGRVGNIVYRTGTPSVNPVAPSINTVSNVVEYRLANVRVETGTTTITSAMITDRRGSSDCPWVTSLIYQVDTSVLYDQWSAAYEEYFEAEKEMWDDWYSHLTEELNVSLTLVKRTNTFVTVSETNTIDIGIPEYNADTDMLEVYINGMRAIDGSQYTINGNTSILLSAPLGIGQTINFVVLKSVVMGNTDDIITLINALEDRIATIQGGNPTVVDVASEMTDTDKIYILTTDSKWYYYNLTSSAWVAGGEYGAVATDTTLTQAGIPADAKVVGDVINEVRADLVDLKSALGDFTPITTTQFSSTDRYSINSSGKIQSAGGALFDYGVYYAPVENGKRYKITSHDTSGDYIYSFFSEVPTTSSTAYNTTRWVVSDPFFVAPINGYIAFRSSFTMTDEVITFVSAKDAVARAEIDALDDRIDGVDAEIDGIDDLFTDVYITESVSSSDYTVHNNVFIKADGTELSSDQWQYIEYAIPANASKFIITAYAGQLARLWVLEDSSGTILGYSSDNSSASLKTETVNLSNYTGAAKLFVNDKKSGSIAIECQRVEKKIDGSDVYVNNTPLDQVLDSTSPLEGKILVCVGDSITAGADMDSPGYTNNPNITVYKCDASGAFSQQETEIRKTYGYQIASRNHMTFYNGGVSGSTMQGIIANNGFSLANGRYTKLPNNLDYLLIWFGWNDNAYGTLGTINDTTNESYYGGYNVVLPYLIDKYPYAKIGLIVPFGATAGHREAVRLLGDKWGLAVWDNYQGGTPLYFGKESSVGVDADIVTANRAKFQANGAHPNYRGHKQLADMIENFLLGI